MSYNETQSNTNKGYAMKKIKALIQHDMNHVAKHPVAWAFYTPALATVTALIAWKIMDRVTKN